MDGVIVVASDVTDLIVAERALKRADLERAELVASETAAKEASRLKTSFVTNISHEIRTPIAGMIGIAELLLADPTVGAAHRRLLDKSLQSGEILLELVGMVLVSRILGNLPPSIRASFLTSIFHRTWERLRPENSK